MPGREQSVAVKESPPSSSSDVEAGGVRGANNHTAAPATPTRSLSYAAASPTTSSFSSPLPTPPPSTRKRTPAMLLAPNGARERIAEAVVPEPDDAALENATVDHDETTTDYNPLFSPSGDTATCFLMPPERLQNIVASPTTSTDQTTLQSCSPISAVEDDGTCTRPPSRRKRPNRQKRQHHHHNKTNPGSTTEETTSAAAHVQRRWCLVGGSIALVLSLLAAAGVTCYFVLFPTPKTTAPESHNSTAARAPVVDWTHTNGMMDTDGVYLAYASPTTAPTVSAAPTRSVVPSLSPSRSVQPSESPSVSPSDMPSASSSLAPTDVPSVSPTVSPRPTSSPSSAPTYNYRDLLAPYLTSRGVDITVDHNVWAINWLTTEADTQFTALTPATLNQKLLQRFALVSLDYRLQNKTVVQPVRAQRNVDECYWTGIVCDYTNTTINTRDGKYVTEIRWPFLETTTSRDDGGSGGTTGGTIAPEIALFGPALQVLDLSNNQLVGTIPETLYQLINLRTLYLFQNHLSGTVSTQLGRLEHLEILHLSHNHLVGTLPAQFKSDSDAANGIIPIKYFNLYSNQLTGTLPKDLRFRRVTYFDVGRNQLTGKIPEELGENMVTLRHLHLDHNEFRGTLPKEYNYVGNGRLESFSINHNRLTGTVPGERSLYNKLVQYTLHNNRFDRMDQDTCRIEVPQGECVELRADCSVCRCNGMFDLCRKQCYPD